MIKRETTNGAIDDTQDDIPDDETFGYFNTDVNLLVLNILMEGFYRKQNIFTLDQFFKGVAGTPYIGHAF